MSSGKKLGVGVIGIGRVAQDHLAAASALKEEIEFLAIADVQEGSPGGHGKIPRRVFYRSL